MFSAAWFKTFAATIPASTTAIDVGGVARLAPPAEYARLLDIGCGIGRTTKGLAARGYEVTGIDMNADALAIACRATPRS